MKELLYVRKEKRNVVLNESQERNGFAFVTRARKYDVIDFIYPWSLLFKHQLVSIRKDDAV